jgi:lipoprotein-anchoring transpeptidase ErfK/SrfK
MSSKIYAYGSLTALIAAAALLCGSAQAQQFAIFSPPAQSQIAPQQDQVQPADPTDDQDAQLPARLKRQVVDYPGHEAAGTVIVDTPHTYLYYVLGGGKAMRYGIGVGREGFTWSGVKNVVRKAEWPDWYPPAEMIARQPYLPRMTAGGPGNPLGARAMYIGGTEYRIHGTNNPSTIGKNVSSGCIRLTNEDVIDLFNRVQVGAKVVVLPQTSVAQAQRPSARVERAALTNGTDAYALAPDDDSPAQRTWVRIQSSRLR